MTNTSSNISAVSAAIRRRVLDITSRARRFNGVGITVGIDPNATYPNGKKVAEVAQLVSNGTRYMPPRPFLRHAMEEARPVIGPRMRTAIQDVVANGGNIEDHVEGLADELKGIVQETILAEDIYDTGRLHDSVVASVKAEKGW